MSEIHRYKAVKILTEVGNNISYTPHGPDVVMAADFDRVTAERDAALGREAALNLQISNQAETIKQLSGRYGPIAEALQQRLTAADEWAAELLVMLRMAWVDNHVSGENCRRIDAALKLEDGDEPNCLLCLDKKTVLSNLAEGYVMDCPDCCGEEG